MKLRRFTLSGLTQFGQYLDQLKAAPTTPPPDWLLTDNPGSEPAADVEVVDQKFATRFDAAKYLYGLLSVAKINSVERDVGLWAWLTLYFLRHLLPTRKIKDYPGALARYVPEVGNYKRYYRHLLLGPYSIYVAHKDDAERVRAVLATPVNHPGDIVEQLASRQELITSKTIMGAATKLYIKPENGELRKGYGGQDNGGPRRLTDILNQFDLTFDLHTLPAERLIEMLPKEFDRFR